MCQLQRAAPVHLCTCAPVRKRRNVCILLPSRFSGWPTGEIYEAKGGMAGYGRCHSRRQCADSHQIYTKLLHTESSHRPLPFLRPSNPAPPPLLRLIFNPLLNPKPVALHPRPVPVPVPVPIPPVPHPHRQNGVHILILSPNPSYPTTTPPSIPRSSFLRTQSPSLSLP